MTDIVLRPGPALLYLERSDGSPMHWPIDVTARAIEFLFYPVILDPSLKLGDIFRLLDACPLLLQVYRQTFAEQLCVEARKGPLHEPDFDDCEFLELRRLWSLDSHNLVYSDILRLHFSMVGPILANGCPEEGVLPGNRARWGVSCSSLRGMLDMPLCLDEEIKIFEEDDYSIKCCQLTARGKCSEISLGEFIHGVLWGMTFFGGPEAEMEFATSFKEAVWSEPMSAETFTEQVLGYFPKAGFEAVLDSLGTLTPNEFEEILRQIPDKWNATKWLHRRCGESLVVKLGFRKLNGRDLREVFGKASWAENPSTRQPSGVL